MCIHMTLYMQDLVSSYTVSEHAKDMVLSSSTYLKDQAHTNSTIAYTL